jgi:hypothetical protein
MPHINKVLALNTVLQELSKRAKAGEINITYNIPKNEIDITIGCFWLTADKTSQEFMFKGKLPDTTSFGDFLETIDRRTEVTHLVESGQVGWSQNPLKYLPLVSEKPTGTKAGKFHEQTTTYTMYKTILGELSGNTHDTPIGVSVYKKARNEFFIHQLTIIAQYDNGTQLQLHDTHHNIIHPKTGERLLRKALLLRERINELNIYDDNDVWNADI